MGAHGAQKLPDGPMVKLLAGPRVPRRRSIQEIVDWTPFVNRVSFVDWDFGRMKVGGSPARNARIWHVHLTRSGATSDLSTPLVEHFQE